MVSQLSPIVKSAERCGVLSLATILIFGCGSKPSNSPPIVSDQPSSVAVNTGESARFSVGANGSAPFDYQWSKTQNGHTKEIGGATTATYTIAAAAVSDSGATFSVKVTNAYGNALSTPASLTVLQPGAWDVITYHNDSGRTGQNLNETVLNPTNVNQSHFGKIGFYTTDGKVDAQPLILSNFPVGTSGRNILYLATEHDTVYAIDADSGTQLWSRTLLRAGESPADTQSCSAIVPEVGITSTPTIDRNMGVIYVVAESKDHNGYYHRLHALKLATGSEMLGGPTTIAATYTDKAVGTTVTFSPAEVVERSALLLANGKIYTSWSSHCDNQPYASWIIALDAYSLQVTHVFNGEPGIIPGQGSFWNSGAGPSADASGSVYALSANGLFGTTLDSNGFPTNHNYGNAAIKLAPPVAHAGTLTLSDYFAMYNTVAESNSDLDFGSGGTILLPDQIDASGQIRHLMIAAGKDTNVYILDRDNMGKFNSTDNSQIWQEVPSAFPNSTNGLFGSPAYFNGTLYFGPTGDAIRGFSLARAKLSTSSSTQTASTFPFPGAEPSISANGTLNGILWAVENSSTQGVLHAYDATNLGSELYNSNQNAARDNFGPGSKFAPPMIANGRVYVTTQVDLTDNAAGAKEGVAVFGILQ